MPNINIDDAYILNETGAQVDKVTGLYFKNENASDTEKAQARANIGAGGSNPNLLDNWYFVGGGSQLGDGIFPINQRGQTSYTSYGWALDRWICGGNASVTLTQSGVTVASSAYDNNFLQRIEPNLYNALVGKTVTLSILATSLSGAWNVGLGNIVLAQFTNAGMLTVTATVQTQAQDLLKIISFAGEANSSITIAAIKLELGTVSTLANDPPPDFGEELRKCQRYLFIRDYAQNDVIANGLTNNLTMFLPVSMRSGGSPTMTFTVTPYVIGNGAISTPTSVNLVSVNGNQVQIYAPTTESHNEQAIVLYAGSATRMTIANEL